MFLLSLRQLPHCGDRTPASVPLPTESRSSPTNTPVFPLVPSSYWVLRGSIYCFPLVRYSCLLSAGVPHALLCLKVYNWCIRGERCTPYSPTPPPSSYVLDFAFIVFVFNVISKNILPIWMLKEIFPMFYSRSFMVLSLMFKSLMHFELIFEYGVR